MAYNPNVPAPANLVQDDIAAMRENFQHLDPLAQAVGELQTVSGLAPVAGELQAVSELAPYVQALLDSRIVEMGSNSNGTYVRWENGLQLCLAVNVNVTRTVNTGLRDWYRSPSDLLWIYPAAFVAVPAAGVFIARLSSIYAWALNRRVSETSLSYMIISSSSADQDVTESFMAIGRWK